MRKASREMPAEWALEVLKRAPFITVSFTRADGTAYGLPMSMACTDDRTWYFHCALEGEKLDAIRAHPKVCLSAVTKCQPTVGPKDGSFTLQYQSAVAFGRAELVTSDEEKILGLRAISQRFLPQHMDAFDASIARSQSRTAVVRITLTAPPTGKRKQYDSQGEEMKFGRME
ncbi:MAG: pyridoxamine 5'-phosphate oxidase family protein [Bacteroidales bacterium]|nr:pyridoxamine 5'-phosphate oxidase family protein [Bacteroidales bacterium]